MSKRLATFCRDYAPREPRHSRADRLAHHLAETLAGCIVLAILTYGLLYIASEVL